MKRLFVFSGMLLVVCLALGIAAWTLPGTVRVAHAHPIGPCSASSPPCTVGDTLEVLSLSGNLFMSGGGGGGGCGGGGATATIINDPLNPGFTLTGNNPCTFVGPGTPSTFSRSEDIGLATVSGLATIEGISASITCGTSGNATFSVSFSTPGGGSVPLTCPHEAVGAVGTVSGHATFTPVSAFTETITLSGSATTSNDTATISGLTFQVSIGAGGPSFTITKTDNGPFTVGTNGTYTFTVTNTGGTATSSTITVTDTLPAGLTFIVGTGTGWTCSASGQTVTCTSAGPIAATASSTITLTASVGVAAVSSVMNHASVSGGGATVTATSPTDTTVVKMTVKSWPAVNISTVAGQQILVVDGAVGTTAAILTVPIPTDTNNFLPEVIVVGPDKRIYICDPALSKIHRVRQDGMQFETVYDMSTATSPNNPGLPEGPSFKGSDLYFNTASATGGTGVWKIAGAAAVAFGGSFNAPTHVLTQAAAGEGTAFGTAGTTSGQLLAVEKSTNRVLSCNPSSCTTPTILIANGDTRVLDRPFGIAVNSAGDIFVANGGSIQNINHFGSDGTFIGTYASFSGKGFPVFLEFDALDRLYVVTNADPTAAGGKVWRIDPPGGETNLVFLVALSTSIPGVTSDEAVGLGVAPTAAITKTYGVSPSSPVSNEFDFTDTFALSTDRVKITFPAVATAFNLTVFREEIPEALLGLQLATNFANISCAEYNSDRGTCVVYEEGVGPKLNPLPPSDYTGPVDFQVFYPGIGIIGTPVLAHARDDMLQTPVDQYDENELKGFTLATSVGDPTGMDGGSGGLSRHVALNTPLVLAGTTFCGFDPPVAQGGLTFSKPQTIAIKFRIAASGGSCAAGPFITNAVSQLWLFDVTTSTFITPGPSGDSSAPNFFHVDTTSGENIFNLSTKDLAPGTYIFTMTSNSVSAQFSFFFLTQ